MAKQDLFVLVTRICVIGRMTLSVGQHFELDIIVHRKKVNLLRDIGHVKNGRNPKIGFHVMNIYIIL
jgi:hypothetical protein